MPVHSKTHRNPAIVLLLACLLGAWIAPAEVAAAPPTIQQATVKGALDKPTIREVVRAHIDEVRDCYNAELVEDETIEGHSVISFEIQPDGSVDAAGVTESTMPERFDACLTKVVESWSFPASGAETQVSYPFAMSAG